MGVLEYFYRFLINNFKTKIIPIAINYYYYYM